MKLLDRDCPSTTADFSGLDSFRHHFPHWAKRQTTHFDMMRRRCHHVSYLALIAASWYGPNGKRQAVDVHVIDVNLPVDPPVTISRLVQALYHAALSVPDHWGFGCMGTMDLLSDSMSRVSLCWHLTPPHSSRAAASVFTHRSLIPHAPPPHSTCTAASRPHSSRTVAPFLMHRRLINHSSRAAALFLLRAAVYGAHHSRRRCRLFTMERHGLYNLYIK